MNTYSSIYLWNSLGKLASTSGSLVIKLDKSMHGKNLTCHNRNSVGETFLNMTLDIKCSFKYLFFRLFLYFSSIFFQKQIDAPKFREKPAPILKLANNNTCENVTLTCKIDSNPRSITVWLKNYEQLVHIGESLTLNLRNASQANESSQKSLVQGKYTCRSKVDGFQEIFATSSVLVNGGSDFLNKKLRSIKTNSVGY